MHRLTPSVRVLIIVLVCLGLLLAAMVSVPLLMVLGSTAADSSDTTLGDTAACGPVANAGGQTITLNADQLANVRIVVQTGQALSVPDRGLVVAVATALQESTLQNLTWGTGTSVGLFQQIDAWGPTSDRTDPKTAATMFFTGGQHGQPGLLDIAGWQSMSINDAAQAVQASAFPEAYAKWEALATSLVQSVIGNDPLGCTNALTAGLPSGAVGQMLTVALAQQGKPYLWGGVGPDAFDCSGLLIYAWGQAGYRVGVRTADEMYRNSTPVAAGSEQPGDLVFGDFVGGVAGHVMIVVRPGVVVEAPHTGDVVKVIPYAIGPLWRLGRLNPSMLTRVTVAA